jgi:hypothetical protein
MRDFAFTIGGMMAMAGFFAADNIISHVICWLIAMPHAVYQAFLAMTQE